VPREAAVDIEGVRAALAGTRFRDVRWFEEIDSTNRYLLDEARAGAEGVVAVADHQTAGRGRLGRTWSAPPRASLLMSVLLEPERLGLAPDERHLLTAACGLAAVAACQAVAGVRPQLKWPNDLLVEDRKLAGILAEADGGALVVGIGINVNWPAVLPPDLAATAVALNQAAGRALDRAELLTALLVDLERWLLQVASGTAGRRELADAYRAACATVGRQVKVALADGTTLVGRAEAITDRGHLVVSRADGRAVEVVVGDVLHLRPAG
jgi:BirA family biotin operon repressor/biotin-[acetyl-CoA-carboxylase] ligase